MGRSAATLTVMLVAFALLAGFFIAVDAATGVRLPSPLSPASGLGRTPTPRPRATVPRTAPTPATTTPATATSGVPVASPAAPRPTIGATVTPPATATSTASTAPGTATTVTTATAPVATLVSTAAAPPISATVTGHLTPAPTVQTAPVTTTAVATALPSPPGGVTPPHYGARLNYMNNTPFTPAFMQSLDERIIVLTNDQRIAHGLASVTESGQLDIIAASRSQDLVKRNYFDHYDPTGPVDASGRHAAAVQELLARNEIAYTEVGENLVGNTGLPLDESTPRQVVGAWMNHPEHRANILHPTYTTIGVGMSAVNRPDGLRVVITQVFVR